jgi:hypothetical protein
MPASIKGLLNDSQIALEKQASDKFGAAVEGFAHGTLGLTDPNKVQPKVNRNDGSWYATSYAAALAGASDFRPKLKFLFKVEFNFTPEAQKVINTVPNLKSKEFSFMIKQVDRPKITFEYEEGVNMYNFRTKALKNIQHRELTMIFMDDVGNRVFDFFRVMMMIHSPITQRAVARDGTMLPPERIQASYNAGNSMAFTQLTENMLNKQAANNKDNAHRAVVNSTFGNSIESIRVKQIFVNPMKGLADAVEMVSYDFINPRITNFDLDELSHESNEVNLLTMVFDYDWMEMVDIGTIGSKTVSYGDDQKQQMMAKGLHGAPTDISPNSVNGGTNATAAGGNKGLSGALGSIVDRQLTNVSKDLASKALKTVAGNGRFANVISQQAGSAFGGAGDALLNGAVSGIGGLLSSATNPNGRTASNVSSSSRPGADSTSTGTPSMTQVTSTGVDIPYGQT